MPEISKDWLEVCQHSFLQTREDVEVDHDGVDSTRPLMEDDSASLEMPKRSLHKFKSWLQQLDLRSPIRIQIFRFVRQHHIFEEALAC